MAIFFFLFFFFSCFFEARGRLFPLPANGSAGVEGGRLRHFFLFLCQVRLLGQMREKKRAEELERLVVRHLLEAYLSSTPSLIQEAGQRRKLERVLSV